MIQKKQKLFDYIKIKLASPSRILYWGLKKLPNGQFIGEIQNSETINYQTFKPEVEGLFCERIFGPIKSLECACGKYKRSQSKGYICEDCGVELTESRVRRHRMGFINLIYPVTHIWYINSRPNYMALLLEVEDLEKQINTDYTINFKNDKNLKLTPSILVDLWDKRIQRIKLASLAYFIAENDILFYGLHWDLQQYRKNRILGFSNYPLKPKINLKNLEPSIPKYLLKATPSFLIGASLIKKELEKLNLNFEILRTRNFIIICTKILNKEFLVYYQSKWFRKWEQQRLYKIREQSIKRVRILENLLGTNSNPSWMILKILPVIPAGLRPIIQLEGGRFAISDLNELYRYIIIRNNRLLKLLEINAPQLIIRNEKRLLQEAVDNLIDNGKREKIALNANNHPLKSLSDILKGKYGRFRQNLLGKRVDYSGRSVIVVEPKLKLNQCGLPYKMAIQLFQPFIIKELINQGLATNLKIAKKFIPYNKKIVESILQKILINHPIFLNRAPTLHRLGIQAFEPILISEQAIQLHPLVCSAFNADFDGDQMAVHIPLSFEAQTECYMLMLTSHNFLSPANGEPIFMPSQDMILGCYYLTLNNMPKLLGSNHYFANLEDVILAYNQNIIEIHSIIWLRLNNQIKDNSKLLKKIILKDKTILEFYKNKQIRKSQNGKIIVQYLKTTTGRTIFNYLLQKILIY